MASPAYECGTDDPLSNSVNLTVLISANFENGILSDSIGRNGKAKTVFQYFSAGLILMIIRRSRNYKSATLLLSFVVIDHCVMLILTLQLSPSLIWLSGFSRTHSIS